MRMTIAALLVAVAAPAFALHPESNQSRMERLRQAEVVVVAGSADHMEQVLRRAQVKFLVVTPDELPQLPLHGQQVLMVNCTGEMSAPARERVRRFVAAGGFLYTTDHAVHHVIEKIFPGTIRWNHKTSNEEIFPMQTTGERGLLKHVAASGHPRWQLAGGGYLFDVIDHQRVDTLMTSSAVGARYGAPVLGVRFKAGDGQVIHVTGHFFTQPGQRPEVAAAGQAFETLSSNVVNEKREDKSRIDNLYNVAPKRPVTMQSAPAPAAPPVAMPAGEAPAATSSSRKVRVLGKKGDYANIRDAEGNEGWVPADSL
jgi:hypothetical protein